MKRKYSFIFLLTIVSFVLLFSVSVVAENSIQTEGFTIEDTELLNALVQYDSDCNGILTVDEMSDVNTLNLDNLPIKSLAGLEVFSFDSISAINCEIESLDGIRNIQKLNVINLEGNNISTLGNLSRFGLHGTINLKNNKLSDINELKKLLDHSFEKIYIEGNPFYDEAEKFMFYEYYKPLSVIGTVGERAFQKPSVKDIIVDRDINMYAEINEIDIPNQKYNFSIEDTSIAEIGMAYVIDRYDPYGGFNHKYSSTLIGIDLLREGKTRMKITCGDFVRYTDIIVLPNGSPNHIEIELDTISDQNLWSYFEQFEKSYSGITTRDILDSQSVLRVNASINPIYDFSSLSQVEGIERIVLYGYTQEMFDNIKGLDQIPNLKKLVFINGNIPEFILNGEFEQLEELVISDNEIVEFSYNGRLNNLELLDLSYNNIHSMDSLMIPKSIKAIKISGNDRLLAANNMIFDRYYFIKNIYGISGSSICIYDLGIKCDIVDLDYCTYESSDNNVAYVSDEGILYLKNPGKAIIKIKYSLSEKNLYVTVTEDGAVNINGDVNLDDTVNASDALLVLKHSAKVETLADEALFSADVTEDDSVNAEDALAILRIAAKIE